MNSDNQNISTTSSKKLISIVIPVYNEEDNVDNAYSALCDIFKSISQYDVEFIFTDNHSEDTTFEKLINISKADKRVRVLRFNRNYGFHRSLMTGYRLAKGDAVVQIDCDLQDPPELIVEYLEHWEQGHNVVVGIRRQREENYFLTKARKIYYAFINRVSDDQITQDAGDFRLVDRSVINKVVGINDNNPYLRGLTSAFAKKEMGIVYDRKKRQYGRSKFPLHRLIKLASHGVFSMTLFPLRLAGHISVIITLFTIGLAAYYLVSALFFGNNWPDGFATLVLLLLFSISLNTSLLAILGKYMGEIFLQQQNRPLVIVEDALNVSDNSVNDVERAQR